MTNWLSCEEVLRLKEIEEVLELYYNSGQFSYSLEELEGQFAGPFAMYEALAGYYREHGLFVLQPSRIRKYEILLEFFRTVAPERVPDASVGGLLCQGKFEKPSALWQGPVPLPGSDQTFSCQGGGDP